MPKTIDWILIHISRILRDNREYRLIDHTNFKILWWILMKKWENILVSRSIQKAYIIYFHMSLKSSNNKICLIAILKKNTGRNAWMCKGSPLISIHVLGIMASHSNTRTCTHIIAPLISQCTHRDPLESIVLHKHLKKMTN